MPIKYRVVDTSHGAIAVEEAGSGDRAVLFIHGNSSSREVFRHQLDSDLGRNHRLIALDLPGHGQSANAMNPERTYTRPGFADVTRELLTRLGISQAALVGWSLGGHIALEAAARFPGIVGMMIVGTPPVAANRMADGFIPAPHFKLGSQEHLDAAAIDEFGSAIFGTSFTPELREAMARTDGLARKTMFKAAQAGAGTDQRKTVEHIPVSLAVVNGANDPFVNLDYLDTLSYANLWDGRCHRLPGLGHAPFREGPEAFNGLLERFLADLSVAKG
jgi:pimeloyl-ACP methyl ester carboxylesterase